MRTSIVTVVLIALLLVAGFAGTANAWPNVWNVPNLDSTSALICAVDDYYFPLDGASIYYTWFFEVDGTFGAESLRLYCCGRGNDDATGAVKFRFYDSSYQVLTDWYSISFRHGGDEWEVKSVACSPPMNAAIMEMGFAGDEDKWIDVNAVWGDL